MGGKLNHPEDDLQRAVLQYLALAVSKHYIVVAIPNGGKRNMLEAKIMKGLGVRAGTPDIHISGCGFSGWLELKAEGGRLSPAQKEFRDECLEKNIPWKEVRDVRDAEEFVTVHQLRRRRRDFPVFADPGYT